MVQDSGDDVTRNVPLCPEELEKLIDARAKEAVKQEREETEARMGEMENRLKQEREERNKLEAMVMSLLQKNNKANSIPPNPPAIEQDIPPEDPEELMQLADDKPLEESKPEEEDEWHAPFGESTYTLLYICRARSQGFCYGIFVYALQKSTILLTLMNILGPGSDNPLGLPPMVDPFVTAAQGVTLFMALAFQSDLIEATLKLREGFYPEILEAHPGATFSTWLISCLGQLFSGFLLLATIFILTMQVDNVLAIMLNFAALHFMAEIDDLGFVIAKLGFVTHTLQEEVKTVVVQVPKQKRNRVVGRILFFLILVGLFIGYGILKNRQLNGEYLPTHIYVQFGDAYNSKIPYYSGILSSVTSRTSYRRKYRDRGTENILLAYCLPEKVWTFSESNNPCDYFAKSQETTTYDVTSIPDSEWEILDSMDRPHPFDSFSLVNRDCNPKICEFNQGLCHAGLCSCPHDRFGMDCEFFDVCPGVAVDPRFKPFPALKAGSVGLSSARDSRAIPLSDEFHFLQTAGTNEYIKAYNMPVYYSNHTYPANILFFGGRRWILTSEWDLINVPAAKMQSPNMWFFPDKTADTFASNFHGYHQANYTPLLISDPVDFETPGFLPTPIGLGWSTVKEDNETIGKYVPDLPLEAVLVCAGESCKGRPDFCGDFGYCNNETGTCECVGEIFSGDRCDFVKPCYDLPGGCGDNGECDESSGYCLCNLPHYGKLCKDTYMCFEDYGSCKNGGVCNMTTGACDCPDDPAISGAACEKRATMP